MSKSEELDMEVKPWESFGEERVLKARVFELFVRKVKSPIRDYNSDFYIIKSLDWCNVIALTPEDEVVLVKQFRHGIEEITLELPGGIMNLGEDSPIEAVKRELLEETGYSVDEVEELSFVHPNPAIQNNKAHLFIARGAKKITGQNLDPSEEISVTTAPLKEIPGMIAKGQITHSIMICAFFQYFLKQQGLKLG